MRKPDGLTAEDALRGRPSLSGLLSPGDTPTQSYPHFPAMRRKSVLPKQSSLSTLPIEDDDDEDEVDDSPALLADTEVPLVITHAEEDDAADYLASGDHARTPTPTPRELPLPTGRASLNVPTPKGARPMGSKLPPTRVSPLKGGAALNPPPARKNGTQPCGVTRPPANGKLPRSRATMQSVSGQAGNRDALASLPVENGQAGVARIKPAGKGPGEQAAARRASMAVYNVI